MEAGQLSSTTAKFAANIEALTIMSSALKSNKKEAEIMSVKHKIINALKNEIVRMEKQLAKKLARVEKVKQNPESATYYSKQAELVSAKIADYQVLIDEIRREYSQQGMLIEIKGVEFSVEHEVEDGEVYLSSVKINNNELIELISPEWLDVILDKTILQIDKSNQELKNDNCD